MLIKICGISTLAAAQAVQEGGADILGLVFAASRRQVTVETAKKIAAAAPGIAKAGVFVNAPLTEVREIAEACRLDYIQLHGDESPEYCALLHRPVIKALRIGPDFDQDLLHRYPADLLLLDTHAPGQYGGTGLAFDWQQAKVKLAGLTTPFLVAGGLSPDNVGQAITILSPQGVDVSGGVETDGAKDTEKIYRFIAAARQTGGAIHA